MSSRFGKRLMMVSERMNKNQRDDSDERQEDAPLVAEPESFGTWLRRQREVREIDLREIADSSKVSMSYLQAFEDDRFDVLPSPVFAKGFLRQYARYVGLDPEEVVNFYLAARHPEGEGEPVLQPRTEPEPPSRNYVFLVLAVIAALVLLVWLLSAYSQRTHSVDAPGSSVVAPEAASPPPAPAREAPAEEPAQALSAVGATDRVESEEPPQAVEPGPPLLVALDFLSDCWVEAWADGDKKVSELKIKGEVLLLPAEEVVEIKIGDVTAVQVEVNGVPFVIEERSGTSVRNVRIDLEIAMALVSSRESVQANRKAASGGISGH